MRFRAGNGKVRKADRTNAGYAGNSLDELLVVAIHVQVLLAARVVVENDFEQIVLVETKIERAQRLEGAHQKARAQQ